MKQRQNAPASHAEREPLQAAALSSAASVQSDSFGASTEANISPRQLAQGALMTQLMRSVAPPAAPQTGPAGAGVVQRKGRVDLSKIEDEDKRKRIAEQIRVARELRISEKQTTRMNWLPSRVTTGLSEDQIKAQADLSDDSYNSGMEAARKKYGQTLKGIRDEHGLNAEQYLDGERYYGVETNGVFKRPGDDGKEYVKGHNDTFMPRYIRRELNQFDIAKIDGNKDLLPTGASHHGDGGKFGEKKATDPLHGTPFTKTDREFLQQSFGGGTNQIAFSHTASKHPILSNAHDNFGAPKPGEELQPHGRIVTDLSKVDQSDRFAQWTLAPEDQGGHKIRRPESDFPATWMGRRKKVIRSGYRNMEVLTSTVPSNSIVARENTWETGNPLLGGVSNAGQWFSGVKKDKEKKVI
ncbi:hypothetical protein [Paucibacter sp. KCTC 42545]|uniref:hypothetical protein n=1 Tax=Paucibacter sp. KCTC 42545 TaxID=1768242 RepID=UPI000733BB78|nr:hypothetical protein [Paucibacter sp. KCTC 42545]ALT76849.1 hypothetical protein AT984_06235 [Paucibacter sp. KCTC 42545]